MMQVFINLIPIFGTLIVCLTSSIQIEAKRIKLPPKCQLDECDLRPQHYVLYSFVKRTVDSQLDLNGKEIYPLLKSIEVLRRRFSFEDASLSGTKLVRSLLANETLVEAEKVFASEDGSALVDIYRSSVNGRSQNLACSQLRVQALERAASKIESNQQLAQVFTKIHRNFIRKSAKKCLKHSCNSIDLSMSKLTSVLGKNQPQEDSSVEDSSKIINDFDESSTNSTNQQSSIQNDSLIKREFGSEELELCRFFKRTNESDCKISANELSEISLISTTNDVTVSRTNHTSLLADLLKAYRSNSINRTYNQSVKEGTSETNRENNLGESLIELNETGRIVLAKCRPLRSLLDYNLAAIRWYRNQGLIDNQKLATRTFWCPSLAYWLQMDRLCGELESSLESFANNGTFAYEVSDKHITIGADS